MHRLAVRILLALAGAGAAAPAAGVLGEHASSVAADEARLGASRRQRTARATHHVEQLESDARTVREYVSPSGVVFAVCWEGLTPPDLSILGAWAAPVRRAVAEQGAPRSRARRVEVEGVVVETWGRTRAVRGRAYVPALVPPGVTLDEIR